MTKSGLCQCIVDCNPTNDVAEKTLGSPLSRNTQFISENHSRKKNELTCLNWKPSLFILYHTLTNFFHRLYDFFFLLILCQASAYDPDHTCMCINSVCYLMNSSDILYSDIINKVTIYVHPYLVDCTNELLVKTWT